jgi:hypothetical protein
MPKANRSGYSNAAAGVKVRYQEGEQSFPGISSLTSENKPDKNGTSSGIDLQSPAPTAESPSDKVLLSNQESSSASSTAGSGRGTTRARRNRQASSADSQTEEPATQASEEEPAGGGFLVP